MGGIGALFWLAWASRAYFHFKKVDRIYKLMSDTKTTPIGSLKPGPVEIKGKVNSTLPPLPSPWTQKHGVFYQFLVQEYAQKASDGKTAVKSLLILAGVFGIILFLIGVFGSS